MPATFRPSKWKIKNELNLCTSFFVSLGVRKKQKNLTTFQGGKETMWTTSKIRRHISKLPDGQLFSTREFLTYGLRAAVDQALHRLVKIQFIIRVARGLFMKYSTSPKIPPQTEIACAKAKAFGKQIFMHGLDAARKLGLAASGALQPSFVALGATTSFQSGSVRITLKGVAPRYVRLNDTLSGLAIRAMRQLPKDARDRGALNQATFQMNRVDREQLRQSAWLMPSWLSDIVYNGRFLCAVGIIQ
jgi:hypothetical protein